MRRIGVITTTGDAYVRQDDGNSHVDGAGWVLERDDVQQVSLSGNRIGVLTNAGEVYMKEGGLSAGWTGPYESNIQQISLSGGIDAGGTRRLGALFQGGGGVFVWEWLPGQSVVGYTDLDVDGVKQVCLTGDPEDDEPLRVGALKTSGDVLVKEGALVPGWTDETGDVQQISLAGNRIGVLKTNGDVYVKQGGLSAAWSGLEIGNTQQISLNSNILAGNIPCLATLQTSGDVYVKGGALDATWTGPVIGDVKQICMFNNWLAVVKENGDMQVAQVVGYDRSGLLVFDWGGVAMSGVVQVVMTISDYNF